MIQRSVLLIAPVLLFAAACVSTPPDAAVPDLTGEWVLTTRSQMGEQDSAMSMVQAGERLSGTLTGEMGTVQYTGSIQGDAVSFGFSFDMNGQPLQIDYAGVAAGDTLTGTATFGNFGEGTFTARRRVP